MSVFSEIFSLFNQCSTTFPVLIYPLDMKEHTNSQRICPKWMRYCFSTVFRKKKYSFWIELWINGKRENNLSKFWWLVYFGRKLSGVSMVLPAVSTTLAFSFSEVSWIFLIILSQVFHREQLSYAPQWRIWPFSDVIKLNRLRWNLLRVLLGACMFNDYTAFLGVVCRSNHHWRWAYCNNIQLYRISYGELSSWLWPWCKCLILKWNTAPATLSGTENHRIEFRYINIWNTENPINSMVSCTQAVTHAIAYIPL